MLPVLGKILGVTFYSYGTAMVTAFIIGVVLAIRTRPREHLSFNDILNFCLITMAALLLSPMVMAVVRTGRVDLAHVGKLLHHGRSGGFQTIPAIIVTILLVLGYCRAKRIPTLLTLDFLVPPAVLGMAIQRTFGCFLAGCCYGKPTSLPWGVVFPAATRAGRHFPDVALHPTQLYYGISLVVIFLLLRKAGPAGSGERTALGVGLIALTYFTITFVRGDVQGTQALGMTLSQWLAAGLVIVSGSLYYRVRRVGSRSLAVAGSEEQPDGGRGPISPERMNEAQK